MPLLPSALPPKGEARRYDANNFLNFNSIAHAGKADMEAALPPFLFGDA